MEKILVYGMTDNRGGMESYIMTLFRNADKSRIAFDFITDFETMAYDEEVKAEGSVIYHIPSKSRHPIKHLTAFRKVLKDHPEYKAVYFNILNAGAAYSMIVPKLLKRKIFTHSHSNSTDSMGLHRMFKSLANGWSDLKLACSESAAEYMFGSVEGATVINNAIDVEDYVFSEEIRRSTREKLGIKDSTFALLHVGRIAPEKNPLFVVGVFAELLKLKPDSVLIYAGTGAMEQETKDYAQKLGVADKILFLGMCDYTPLLYRAGDAFILPSVYEGLGIVLIEAQAAGLQCFASANVPEAAAVTKLLEYLPLEDGEAAWAARIAGTDCANRPDTTTQIESAGFSAKKNTKEIEDILLISIN